MTAELLGLAWAFDAAAYSTCPRAKVGAILGKVGPGERVQSLGLGWNTTLDAALCTHPAEQPCDETIHAEAAALAQLARRGYSAQGLTAFLTLSPCTPCARLLVVAGVARVVYAAPYRDPGGLAVLFAAGVPAVQYEEG